MAIYNIKKHSIQRRMEIKDVAGITKSTDKNCFEFVVHHDNEYDYRLVTDERKRDEIFLILKHCYYNALKKNIPVYGVAYSHLKDFTTGKDDIKDKISRIPPKGTLLKDEDLFRDKWNKISKQPPGKESSFNEDAAEEEKDDYERVRKATMIFAKEEDNEKIVGFDDFERLKVIGKGTFGKVYLVRKITDGKIYAMKSIRKDIMIENDQIESAKMEKQILLQNQYPFLVKMSYVFQDKQKVYFVMNFIRGGELFTHLNNEKRFPEDKARFYAIQIMLSLGYLHKQDIIYRDIKPENILIGDDGYLFLADFGLAKNVKKGQLATTF
jgi:serum/glucocorticoid-regulated kinase 2